MVAMSELQGQEGARRELTATRAVLVGHLVVTLPTLLAIAIAAALGAAFNHVALGLIVGSVIGWIVWAFLVPPWRDWVSGTNAPMAEVQKLAQRTGLIWRQGSAFERTEMQRKDGRRGW